MALVPCARRLPALMSRTALMSGTRTAIQLLARSESTINNPMPAAATTSMPYMRTGGKVGTTTEAQTRFLLKGGEACEGVVQGRTKVMLSSLIKNLLPKIDTRSQKHYNRWAASKNDCSFFYTKRQGRLVGFVCFHRADSTLTSRGEPQVVDLLYVSPAFRQEGVVAQDLLAEVVKHHEEVTTVCPDEDSAKVYEQAGFKRQEMPNSGPDGIVMAYP